MKRVAAMATRADKAKEPMPVDQRCAGCGEPLFGDPAEGVGLVMSVDPVLGFAGPLVHYGTGCIHKVPRHRKERHDAE